MTKLNGIQIQLAEQLLLSVVRKENVIEYNEIASRVNPHMNPRNVGDNIGEVSKVCNEIGLPLISVKVIGKGSHTAGRGFYNLMKGLGRDISGKTEKELFSAELKAVRECKEWYRLADHLGLKLELPRPEDGNNNTFDEQKQSSSTQQKASKASSSWIFPSNCKKYDVISAFSSMSEINWSQLNHHEIGDDVFIYCGMPYQRIMYHAKVVEVDVPPSETIDDLMYWSVPEEREKDVYVRLRLVNSKTVNSLALSALLDHGLGGVPQGRLRAEGDLLDYIRAQFNINEPEINYPDECSDSAHGYYEGAVRKVTINAYERNPIARKKCIAIHGAKCAVCDFDFSKTYGSAFEGLIHVHHIRPLHTVAEQYLVDPEKDLFPVCPNCHMAIHSKADGFYTIEELRKMIRKA